MLSLDSARFTPDQPPKLECTTHIVPARRSKLRLPQVALNSSVHRMVSYTGRPVGLRIRWDGPVYGLLPPGLNDSEGSGFVLFDDNSGKLPFEEDQHNPPGSFGCMVVGARKGSDDGKNMDTQVTVFMIAVQPTKLQDEYKRIGVATLALASDSEFLLNLPQKRTVRIV